MIDQISAGYPKRPPSEQADHCRAAPITPGGLLIVQSWPALGTGPTKPVPGEAGGAFLTPLPCQLRLAPGKRPHYKSGAICPSRSGDTPV